MVSRMKKTELIYKNNVRGRHFLQRTEEKLVTVCKLTFGRAAIIKLIAALIKCKFPLSTYNEPCSQLKPWQCLMLMLIKQSYRAR